MMRFIRPAPAFSGKNAKAMFVPRIAAGSKIRETLTVGVMSAGGLIRAAYRAEGEGDMFDRSELMGFSLSGVSSKYLEK
jgi:hypothetical protein